MPRRKSKRMRGYGTLYNNSIKQLTHLKTANRNLRLDNRLLNGKPPLQQPGQLARPLQYGGALRDKYGAYLYVPHT
jgi:hypothetical protein